MHRLLLLMAVIAGCAQIANAQTPPRPPLPPPIVSPEVGADRRITFRISAPDAEAVRLTGSDIPGVGGGVAMTKGANGVWETTLGPVEPGAYRYLFSVNGVPVVDPRSPSISESVGSVWSLVVVPGSEFQDTRDVPHGAVASIPYYSTALGRFRRMHVYTPPGYEGGRDRLPVLYLLHGAGDSDDSWSSVGRAGIILDNLIADKKALPMLVVMPAGHTRPPGQGRATAPAATPGAAPGAAAPADEFTRDFLADIVPTIEKTYRVQADRAHRAIAGLSMGGSQSLNIAIPHLDRFGYVGVFSSGLIGAFGPIRPGAAPRATGGAAPARPPWEEQHRAELDDANAKKGLKLLWFRTGSEDFLLPTTRATVEMLKRHGFNAVFEESPGGHTWLNWRNYLRDFAPLLFR